MTTTARATALALICASIVGRVHPFTATQQTRVPALRHSGGARIGASKPSASSSRSRVALSARSSVRNDYTSLNSTGTTAEFTIDIVNDKAHADHVILGELGSVDGVDITIPHHHHEEPGHSVSHPFGSKKVKFNAHSGTFDLVVTHDNAHGVKHVVEQSNDTPSEKLEVTHGNDQGTSVLASPTSFHDRLAAQEIKLMRLIQGLPGLRPVSMAVHYSLLPQVVTPALAILTWLVSLPKAASLICFVCFSDILNTAIKWAVQRPRPLWYSDDPRLVAKQDSSGGKKNWEADYSFPSAHTQFFSGLAFCACVLSGCASILGSPLAVAFGFGTIVGVTRNYLGVHWPTDTTAGLVLGGVLGILWGKYDPYSWLLKSASPQLSLAVATSLTGSLVLLLAAVRVAFRPVDDETHAKWCRNIMSRVSASSEADESSFMPRPREIRAKIAMLSTIWCTLAFTALCPAHLPTAMSEPLGCVGCKLLQTTVGLGGLGGWGVLLKKTVMKHFQKFVRAKTTLKGLAYAGICAWTFLLTQLVSHRLLALIG